MRLKRWIVPALSALVMGAGPMAVSTSAQTTGPGGRIVFSRFSSFTDDYDIWAMNPDGTELTNLTNTPSVDEFDPNWSPDGSKIAFSSSREDPNEPDSFYGEIFTMGADGSNRTNVTDTVTVGEFQPSWSPDGRKLAFAADVPGEVISNQSDIFTINIDGTMRRRLTFEDTQELLPAWSPLGDKIAFTAVRNGDYEIVTVNTDGGGEVNLTNNFTPDASSREDWAPDWSPDGTKIVFMGAYDNPCCEDWEIWAMNADGSGQTNLTNNPAGDDYPSWSPDGMEIVFQSNRATGWRTDLWKMPAPATLGTSPATSSAKLMSARSAMSSPAAASAATATMLTSGGNRPDWGGTANRPACTLTGTAGDDTLVGTSGADAICGMGGNDVIRARRGQDIVSGGRGNDMIWAGRGRDVLRGQRGDDILTATDSVAGNDVVDGNGGVDRCDADAADTVRNCP